MPNKGTNNEEAGCTGNVVGMEEPRTQTGDQESENRSKSALKSNDITDTGKGNKGYCVTQANRKKRTEHSKEVTQHKKAGPYGILWGRSTGDTPFNGGDTD
jgi:hypothetical protein